jgi:hypothetical protein
LSYGTFAFHVVVNLVFAALAIASWALRPPGRVVGGDLLEKQWAASPQLSAAHKPA